VGLRVHVTELEISSVVPFAVAVNFWVFPTLTDAFVGAMVIEVMPASVTVIVAVLLWVPDAPVMVAWPGATAVTNPVELFTVATD
jgi:hypothetical protein